MADKVYGVAMDTTKKDIVLEEKNIKESLTKKKFTELHKK